MLAVGCKMITMMTVFCYDEVVYQARIWSNMMRNAPYSISSLGWIPSQ